MAELLYKDESFKIIGICMEIHRVLGMGLKEANYKDAMEIEFCEQQIEFSREKRYMVKYKDKILKNPYVADFVVFNSIVIEVKSTPVIIDSHLAQGLSYLAVSG